MQDSIGDADSETLVFFFEEADEELSCVASCELTVPLNKELETFVILKYGAQAAQRKTFDCGIALLNQLE